jgi:hypothetical protein
MKKLLLLIVLGLCAAANAANQPLDRDLEQAVNLQPINQMTESSVQAWDILTRMSDVEKANAIIDIELPSGVNQNAIQTARTIENLWNDGQFDAAIATLQNLATEVEGAIAIGVSWRTPLVNEDAGLWGPDIRIGTRDSIYQTSMDVIYASGTLFCILTYKEGSTYFFSVNRSSNSGQTWSETYTWAGGGDSLRSASGTCVSGVCWVGYASKVNPYQARVRRFNGSTGQTLPFANGSSYDTIFTSASPDTIKELVMFSNQDNLNNRVYCMLITRNGSLRFFWADTSGANWNQISTGITNASHGLSATWNEDYTSRPFWFSYISLNDSLMIYCKTNPDTTIRSYATAIGSGTKNTSITAYHDTIFCAYEYNVSGFECRYRISYGGTSWTWGNLCDTTITNEAPAATARRGGGISAIYRFYTPTRQGHYIHRTYQYMPWPDPVTYTNYELWWNKPSLVYLGGGDYGVVYLTTSSPAIRGAFFDRVAASDIGMAQSLPNAFSLNQNYPNPFNAKTCIQYNLPRATDVMIEIFDILGRKVQTIQNGYQQAGPHSLIWNAENFGSGIYFAKITADGESQSIQMTLLK